MCLILHIKAVIKIFASLQIHSDPRDSSPWVAGIVEYSFSLGSHIVMISHRDII